MGMEDDTRGFLLLIVQTISLVLLWMMINVLLGIYFNLGFFDDKPNWKNIAYYLFFILSLTLLVRHIRKKWKI